MRFGYRKMCVLPQTSPSAESNAYPSTRSVELRASELAMLDGIDLSKLKRTLRSQHHPAVRENSKMSTIRRQHLS